MDKIIRLLEEATVACLAKDNESEAIVRKLFRLFFTGRPEEEQEKEAKIDHIDSQFARALQDALESGDLHPAAEISEEISEGANGKIEQGQFTEAKPSTEERKHEPGAPVSRIQAAPTHHPQTPVREGDDLPQCVATRPSATG